MACRADFDVNHLQLRQLNITQKYYQMKIKFFLSLLLGAALTASAEGYKDGIEYFKAGQYANAKTILEQTLNQAGTDKAMSYYYLGQIALIEKNNAAAKTSFEKGIQANEFCAYNYVGLGSLALLDGNNSAADEYFKDALKIGKKNHEITVDIARAYYNADPVKYAKDIEKYLTKAHKDSKHAEPAIYILEGDMLFDAKDLGGAAAKYEMATTYDEANPEGYVKYANAYMGVNPQYGVAKLEELLGKQPGSALAQRELAEKYYETNQWTKAANQYRSYINNPNHFPEDRARYAVLLYANSEYANSLAEANKLLETNPNDFQTRRLQFLNLAELKKFDEAAQSAQEFLALVPNAERNEKFNPNDYITYGSVLSEMGNDSIALEQYLKAVELDPSKYDNFKILAEAYTKIQNYQAAAEAFDNYLKNNPSPSLTDFLVASGRWLNAANYVAKNDAENTTLREEAAKKGIEAINKVIAEASTPSPVFYQRKGRLYYAIAGKSDENVKDAYTELIQLLDTDPANADPSNPSNKLGLYSEAYLFIGNYYQEQGDKDKQNENYSKSDYYKKLAAGEAVE